MKNMLKLMFGSLFLALAVTSCKKDENRVIFLGGTAPALTSSAAGPLVLLKENKDNVAMVLNWTNPDYMFNTGVSSQDVSYILQVDTTGKNFTSGNIQERSIARDTNVVLTVGELNTFLSKMELQAGRQYNVEMRIKSTLGSGAVPLYSNVLQVKLTPYLDFAVEPPGTAANNYEDGNLWVTGNCFPSPDWSNPLPAPYDVSLKFTKIDKLHYELICDFDAAGAYKMIQTQGVWATQYHALDGNAPLSGEFEKKDADPGFASPGVGRYKIEVNFQTGRYKLTPQ